jgi:ribonuclease-3
LNAPVSEPLARPKPAAKPAALSTDRLEKAQSLLGHRFAKPDLLAEALTHRSAASGRVKKRRGRRMPKSTSAGSNERLEFIGDRVLGLVMAEWVAERFPAEQESDLGPRYAELVSREAVCAVAETLGLTSVLAVGANEALAGVGKLSTVLADAMEAAIGALYLDGGLGVARDFIRRGWDAHMLSQIKPPKDPKTALQERALMHGGSLPIYETLSSAGPSHAPHFIISVSARGKTATGEGSTKRNAERQAATALLEMLK